MSTDSFLKPTLTIPWTPVTEYVERIMARSELRGWGFTELDACKLADSLRNHDHFGDLYPVSVRMWLGNDLMFNWSELMLWIEDEISASNCGFNSYLDVRQLAFLPGSEISGERSLDVVDLDLQTFWDKDKGIMPINARATRDKWPSLEVAVMLALNPQVYTMIDGNTVPGMLSSGLVVDSICLPNFSRDNCEVYVHDRWRDDQWRLSSMVAFREC